MSRVVYTDTPTTDAQEALRADVTHWQAQADELAQDTNWPSVDAPDGMSFLQVPAPPAQPNLTDAPAVTE